MRIELIATGDELLNGTIVDTNSPWLLERLAAQGLPVWSKTMVRDVRAEIVDLFRASGGRSDIVICSGGLGPTADDITAECAAEAAGVGLTLHAPTLASIETRLAKRGIAMTPNNRRQAMIPDGSIVHTNRFGTAPMLELRIERARTFLLPGVPREYHGLCDEVLLPALREVSSAEPLRRVRVLRCYGIAESHLDEKLADLSAHFPGLSIGYRTTLPENHVRLVATGRDPSQVEGLLDRAAAEAQARIGAACFSSDGRTFSETLGRMLRAQGATVAVAESVTGGLTAALLTEAAGASDYTRMGVVAYTEESKRGILGVPAELLTSHGAVSEAVAASMAQRARELARAPYGVSCTGLAGPGTASSSEPVGTVFTALATGSGVRAVRHAFGGDRERIRRFAAYATLDALRLELLHPRPA
ncbi:MAG TPA: CinA family nicotinamide mononucleotide deamidase-related protein [Myxococcales bacterium]|nr:CinA family nicotinamide mononucleotide deamidase-related protein [Myxococcales bacterium]